MKCELLVEEIRNLNTVGDMPTPLLKLSSKYIEKQNNNKENAIYKSSPLKWDLVLKSRQELKKSLMKHADSQKSKEYKSN